MNRRNLLVAALASAGAIVAGSMTNSGGFRFHFPEGERRTSLLIGTAAAMLDLCKALSAAYKQKHPLTDIVLEKGDSLQGLIAVKRGAIDIAAITRDLTAEEDSQGSFNFLIARSNIAIIVNTQSPVKNLSQDQIRQLFTGEINNWKLVGGPDAPVTVISRMRGSSTRQFMEEVVLDGAEFCNCATEVESTRAMATSVAEDVYAVGYISAKDQAGDAKFNTLAVDGVAVSNGTVLSNRYAYTHSFYLLIAGEQEGAKAQFVEFARSPEGQAIVSGLGLVAVC